MQAETTSARHTWTIMGLIRWTCRYFRDRGIENPRLDAEVLLAHCLGSDRVGLYLRHDQPLDAPELARFKEMVKRRAGREPVAYITGYKEFWSLKLDVTPQVLIPRPDTEILVEKALEMLDKNEDARVFELGTGSGAISLALASRRPRCFILASDLSFEAVALARSNADKHGLAGRIEFLVSDWMNAVGTAGDFDLIVSNPPYIPTVQMERLEPEVSRFEPRLALDGGPEGLDSIARLVVEAGSRLRPGGWLLLEIGSGQKKDVEILFKAAGCYEKVEAFKDYGGHWRVVAGCRSGLG